MYRHLGGLQCIVSVIGCLGLPTSIFRLLLHYTFEIMTVNAIAFGEAWWIVNNWFWALSRWILILLLRIDLDGFLVWFYIPGCPILTRTRISIALLIFLSLSDLLDQCLWFVWAIYPTFVWILSGVLTVSQEVVLIEVSFMSSACALT